MCRLLGKVSRDNKYPTYELLNAPHSLHEQSFKGTVLSKAPKTGEHRDGSGVAWFEGADLRIEKRGGDDCWDSTFRGIVSAISTPLFLAHNRKASPGLAINYESSHPFEMRAQGGVAAFCHNGGIRSLMTQAIQESVSDSKLFSEYLGQRIASFSLDEVAQTVSMCASSWDYSSINGLLLTPHALFAWRCFNDKHVLKSDFNRYYTIFAKCSGDAITVASEPIDSDHDWVEMGNRTILVARRGDGGLELESVDL